MQQQNSLLLEVIECYLGGISNKKSVKNTLSLDFALKPSEMTGEDRNFSLTYFCLCLFGIFLFLFYF